MLQIIETINWLRGEYHEKLSKSFDL
jgi:hypothetical protein